MRYTLESALPLGAFKPRGGLFAGSMTLHGGGGGFIGDIGNSIGNAFSGIGGALSGVVKGVGDLGESLGRTISDAGVSIDEGVNEYIPGGWGTVAAVAVPFAAPYLAPAMTAGLTAELGAAGAAAALSSGTSAATSAIQGKSLEDTLKSAALAGATSYGLSSLGGPSTDAGTQADLDLGKSMTENASKIDQPSLNEAIKGAVDSAPANIIPPGSTPDADSYMRQFADAFSNPDAPLPAFEPTAGTVSSDVPSPDLVKTAPTYVNPVDGSAVLVDPAEAITQEYLKNAPGGPTVTVNPTTGGRIFDYSNPVSAENDAIAKMGMIDRLQQMPGYLTSTFMEHPYAYTAGALGLAGLAGQGPLGGLGQKMGTAKLLGGSSPSPSTKSNSSAASKAAMAEKDYKYGSAGVLDPNYLLRNRINAGNVYSGATGYRPVTKMADGGEVKHFGLGGIADGLTQVFQPIEKAVVQPIGQAAPFLKDALPYAGMIAAPFIASPVAAAGVGALASGMGKGGFNMKRALMGGISAYGMSNLGAGLEAAGGAEPSGNFFRSPGSMTKGLENLTAGGNSYDTAAKAFGTRAGFPSAGMAIMGQSGVSAVNEGIDQQAAADQARAQSEAAQNVSNEKTKAARDRAFAAMHAHPYQYAMGGMIPNPPDDQTGMPNQTPMQNFEHGGPLSYAMGGYAMGGEPRFLSGGGDGMSDSIHANISGTQEARLADGEFVVPADVVSGLGNGSSKAGAKQLYSMMDRVRQSRTGSKQQGKQINPRKVMAA